MPDTHSKKTQHPDRPAWWRWMKRGALRDTQRSYRQAAADSRSMNPNSEWAAMSDRSLAEHIKRYGSFL